MIEREADSNEEIKALVDSDVWTGFLEADIKPTKALNEMVLAGQKDSEEEEKSWEEKVIEDIFARFSSNTSRSSSDDDSEKKEIVEDIDPNLGSDSDDSEGSNEQEEEEDEEEKNKFYANSFWKVETTQNIDDLLKEFS